MSKQRKIKNRIEVIKQILHVFSGREHASDVDHIHGHFVMSRELESEKHFAGQMLDALNKVTVTPDHYKLLSDYYLQPLRHGISLFEDQDEGVEYLMEKCRKTIEDMVRVMNKVDHPYLPLGITDAHSETSSIALDDEPIYATITKNGTMILNEFKRNLVSSSLSASQDEGYRTERPTPSENSTISTQTFALPASAVSLSNSSVFSHLYASIDDVKNTSTKTAPQMGKPSWCERRVLSESPYVSLFSARQKEAEDKHEFQAMRDSILSK